MWHGFTFWVFIEVGDVSSEVRADCFGADLVAHHALITGDWSEAAISLSLPEDPVTVHLETCKYCYYFLLKGNLGFL